MIIIEIIKIFVIFSRVLGKKMSRANAYPKKRYHRKIKRRHRVNIWNGINELKQVLDCLDEIVNSGYFYDDIPGDNSISKTKNSIDILKNRLDALSGEMQCI